MSAITSRPSSIQRISVRVAKLCRRSYGLGLFPLEKRVPPCFGKMPLCPARWNLSAVRILKKPFSLARKTVINSTQISHIIRHNNMAIFAPLTLSDKNIACFQINILCFEVERLAGRIPQHSSNLNTTGRISSG